jgi:ribosomal protein S18
MPNPLYLGGPWCDIFKKHGNDPYPFPLMQKYQKVPKSKFCKLCKSVGHKDKDYRTLEMMKERIADTYRVQYEHIIGQSAQQPQYNTAHHPYYNPL